MRDNMVDVVMGHASRSPGRTAAVFVHDDDGDRAHETSITYGELDRAARARAAWLRERCSSGDRALLLYPSGLEFIRSLLGCLYAGVVPVPAPMPDGRPHHLKEATGIALDVDPRMVLTQSSHLGTVADWAGQQGLDRILCTATDTVTGSPDQWCRPLISREPFALLRNSWGAGAEPYGVMIGHDNLVHALDSHSRALGLTPDSVFANWLPIQRGTGLVESLLTALYAGTTAVLMSPETFLREPFLWLRTMSRWRAEVGIAPGFAYDLCAAEVTLEQAAALDLSGWRHACTLDTPAGAGTRTRFEERFASSGFRPSAWRAGYGSAGTTGLVAVSAPGTTASIMKADRRALEADVLTRGTDADAPRLVGLGSPAGVDVRVVDPHTFRVVPDGRIGEIWLRGRSLGRGFWNKQDATVATFRAVTADGQGGFLRTGDLGAVLDGEIFMSGRLEDVLVLQGRRLYPQHLEHFIESLDKGLSGLAGSVFTVAVPGQEVVAVHECEPAASSMENLSDLAVTIREAIAGSHGIAMGGLVLVRPGDVPRTDTGGVSRARVRELFIHDALEPLYEDLHPDLRRTFRPHDVL
ncbi:AMP-binding protein [Streptomyces sp. NPDC052101]|uniref:AMP-binding protein n=1 Tax=Streptomyces sp. NPDC052101 TaxID=3155763 RepID=UPI00342BD2F6